jgi:replicative superfamily II helicase
MIQDLADKIWSSVRFRRTAKAIERAWLTNELKLTSSLGVSEEYAARAMSAAAILACSTTLDHRIAALRLSTYIFETFESCNFPFDSALRVVLARLGNFPSFGTRESVDLAFPTLPWTLAAEELQISDAQSVKIGDRTEVLTNFQHLLWKDLTSQNSVAFSAPTSGGKSFVLELYLASLFAVGKRSVAYIVPTRALINQVSSELGTLFRKHNRTPPDIITVPLRPTLKIAHQAIYVMTQERIQLSLQSHPEFQADVIVVDEAHSISEGARGILLQAVIEEMLARNPTCQILFASPTTRNLDAFGRLFRLPNISIQSSQEPTVSQNFLIARTNTPQTGCISITATREHGGLTDLGEISTQLRLRSRIERLAHVPLALCEGQPNLIYANGADEAEEIALRLAKQIDVKEPTPRLSALSQLSKESVHSKYVLSSCVEKGIAFHYANIPTRLRQEIEAAFADGELNYLVCTSTLLQGVNLPAKNIFMFRPTRGQGKQLESPDFWNLAGRAGRLRREFQGNIFLIDDPEWGRRPLKGPKEADIAPAIEKSIKHSPEELLNIIQAKGINASKSKKVELESAFVRLFTDYKTGLLDGTLERLNLTNDERRDIKQNLAAVAELITLPPELLKRSHNVSAHRQQKLYQRLKEKLASNPDAKISLIPLHPSDRQAYNSYSNILELCHEIILGVDTSRRLHQFHAALARLWMLGWSVPRIISHQIKREKRKGRTPDIRKIIRDTLQVIEEAVRFQTIRLFGCYNAILEFALAESGSAELSKQIPDVALFLEIGASNQTMVSLISLGLSRAVAIKLNGSRSEFDPELNLEDALEWLRGQSQNLESLGLSELQVSEVNEILSNSQPKIQE